MSDESTAMVVASDARIAEETAPGIRYSTEQRRLILETCCGGASEKEAAALIGIAEARGLNVLAQECYFVKRPKPGGGGETWAVQASIDSFRIRAERTGIYDGQDEPEYEYNDKKEVVLARVRVYRKDWTRPMVGVARWDEYVQTTREGKPTRFWAQMPFNQLAKCAEALALRKAFPNALAKVYTPEEMAQADNGNDAPRQQHGPLPKPLASTQAAQLPAKLEESVTMMDRAVALNLKLEAATTVGALLEAWSEVAALRREGLPSASVERLQATKDRRKVYLRAGAAAE